MPEEWHSALQHAFSVIFALSFQRWRLFARPELRMRLPNGNVRIPDVGIFARNPQRGEYQVPIAVVEILSPDDRVSPLLEKLQEYREAGIEHVWVLEPETRRCWTYDGGLQSVTRFGNSRSRGPH